MRRLSLGVWEVDECRYDSGIGQPSLGVDSRWWLSFLEDVNRRGPVGTCLALICEPWTTLLERSLSRTLRSLRRWLQELSNRPAITAVVLGITSIVHIPAFALGLWASLGEVDTWVVILYFISLLGAICASLFGVEGRRLAKVGAPGRVPATIGLALGIGFIVVSVPGVIVGLIVISIVVRNDCL